MPDAAPLQEQYAREMYNIIMNDNNTSMDDAVVRLSLNPIGVAKGKRTQTEQTVFICCDVEVPRMGESNDMFKYSALHVYILVHCSLMQTPNGTRLDLLADKVDRLLSGNRDFGIGGCLSLVSLKRFMPNEEYYGVELYYEGCDFHNANCTPRNVK